jgi:hypothetical protein
MTWKLAFITSRQTPRKVAASLVRTMDPDDLITLSDLVYAHARELRDSAGR